MPNIGDVLPEPQLAQLRASFATPQGKAEMDAILRGVLPDLYSDSRPYVQAVLATYFDDARRDPDDFELDADDRERCIIALLAAQGGQFTLAIHIYLGLMLGITLQEIAHVILLSGVYTGVNRFAEGMFVHVKTLQTLAGLSGDFGPQAVKKALSVAFGVEPAPRS